MEAMQELIKLHIAQNKGEDVISYDFDDAIELKGFMLSEVNLDKVYLFAINDFVFVTEYLHEVVFVLDVTLDQKEDYIIEGELNFVLHEYDSFESAYEVALLIKETSELCYEEDEIDIERNIEESFRVARLTQLN